MPINDHQLLRQHLRDPSSHALATLIERHLPLVQSVARRITNNDEAARDISQTVFLRLVKKASKIPSSLPLTAWFHRETHSAAVDHVRSETRRQKREQTAASFDSMNASPQLWEDLAPEIDGAIDQLSENDRALVLLRFYQNKTHPQIARELGIREDAARMRTNRALEKLRAILGKRGITTTSALLASTLPSHAVSPATPSLAASINTSLTTIPASAGALAFVKTHLTAFSALAIGAAAVTTQQIKINQLEQAQTNPPPQSQPQPSTRPSHRSTSRFSSGENSNLLAIFANPDPSERLHLIQKFSLSLPIHQIPDSLKLLREKTPHWDSESKILTHLLLTRWAKADPEAAFASLDDAHFSLERGHSISILAALAALDPRRAANWLTSPSNTRAFYPLVGHILSGTIAKEWARQDPQAALEWARTLADQQQAGAYSGVLGTIAATDPRNAAAMAITLEPGDARDHILGEIAKSWALHSPEEALEWTSKLELDASHHATSIALQSWSETQPSLAAQYLDQHDLTTHLEIVASQWSLREPANAATWVTSKPPSPERNSALGKTLWNWTTQNPNAAITWVESQPSGPTRDHAIAGLATAAVEFAPETALEWAQKISDPSLREELTLRTFTTWSHRDPATAQQWGEENKTKTNN